MEVIYNEGPEIRQRNWLPWVTGGLMAMTARNGFWWGYEMSKNAQMQKDIVSKKKMKNGVLKRKRAMSEAKANKKSRKMKPARKTRRTRKGSQGSKSGGFLEQKRVVKNKKFKRQQRGHFVTFENNQSVSRTSQVAYVGHYSHPIRQLRYEIVCGILKRLFAEASLYPAARDTTLESIGFVVGDQISLEYEATPGAATAAVVYTIVALDSFNTLIAHFGDASRPYWAGTSHQPRLNRIFINPNTGTSRVPRCYLDLIHTKVSVYSESHMKIQNRTVDSAGIDSSEEVNNIPLTGKGYVVNTSVAEYAGSTTTTTGNQVVIADPVNGSVNLFSGANENELPNEPPQASYFRNCKAIGNVLLDPGQIKTSTIKATVKGYVNQILQRMNGIDDSTGRRLSLGMMKFFALEKMLNSSAQPILITFEINTSMYVSVNSWKNTQMKPVFFTA